MTLQSWTYIEPTGEAKRGPIRHLASTALGAKRFVTAVGTISDKLKVFTWGLNTDGSVKFLDSHLGEVMQSVSVAALDLHRFVTAELTKKGYLRLTVWATNKEGKITKLTEYLRNDVYQGKPALIIFSDNLIVTVLRNDKNSLTLITFNVYIDGSYATDIDMREIFEDELIVEKFAAAPYDAYPEGVGNLATAVITLMGKDNKKYRGLKVINWRIRIDGRIDRLGDEDWGVADDVVAAPLSHKRIVTASTSSDGFLTLNTWDFDALGNVSMREFKGAEEKLRHVDIATLSAARVITSGRDRFGKLKLLVWDAIDKITYLGEAHREESINGSSIVGLGSDWIVTPVVSVTGDLKVFAWKEHAIPLLISEWVPPRNRLNISKYPEVEDDHDIRDERPIIRALDSESSKEVMIDPIDKVAHLPSNKFYPSIGGVDPMVAAGFKYLIVSQQGQIAFFDKKGNKLLDANGNWNYAIDDFFLGFLNPKLSNGTPNENCINRHVLFPLHGPYRYPPGFRNFDPEGSLIPPPGSSLIPPGIVDFYDTRIQFEPESRRFFVFAFSRPHKFVNMKTGLNSNKYDTDAVIQNKNDNMFNRRYWAFAVSKTEDPRDGFYQWMSTEPYVRDAPAFTVNKDVLIVSVISWDLPYQPFGIKPSVYILSVEDLVDGNPYPKTHKLFAEEFPNSKSYEVLPVTHYGNNFGTTFLFQGQENENDGVIIYSFKNPSNWKNFPPIKKTSSVITEYGSEIVPLNQKLRVPNRFFYPPSFRDGKIYYSWPIALDKSNKEYHQIVLLRLPLKSLQTTPKISTLTPDGYLIRYLPTQFGDSNPSDIISCEVPTVTVNKQGHIVVLWCRVGIDTQQPYPEVRYTTFYSDNRGLTGSKLLQKGYAKSARPSSVLDYQTAVVDPSDDLTVWMASEYADKTGSYKMVVGKAKP